MLFYTKLLMKTTAVLTSLQLTTLTEISTGRDAVNMELCGAVLVSILPSTRMSRYPDIDACIQAARLIAAAGDMAPFPFIKACCEEQERSTGVGREYCEHAGLVVIAVGENGVNTERLVAGNTPERARKGV
ncbi:hypothetical protein ARMGADRAFT_1103386 [Armillaria gallica]|uniref:Uncharacterized protein n=1 Tax=Armillaria gallica TaxID=47427 RepID=A0A2H3CJH1_ARMGA|nr:hypothetical protein ARMGADRAFT_1103386 [Armillaria gallica]